MMTSQIATVCAIGVALFLLSLFFSRRISIVPILLAALAGAEGRLDVLGIDAAMWCGAMLASSFVAAVTYRILARTALGGGRHLLDRLRTRWILSLAAWVLVAAAFLFNLRHAGQYMPDLESGWPLMAALLVGLVAHVCPGSCVRRTFVEQRAATALSAAAVVVAAPFLISPALLICASSTAREMGERKIQDGRRLALELLASAVLVPALAFATSYLVVYQGFTLGALIVLLGIVLVGILIKMAQMRSDSYRKGKQLMVREEEMDEDRRKLYELEVNIIQREKDSLMNLLDLRRSEVTDIAEKLTEQREFMHELYDTAKQAKASPDVETKDALLHQILSRIDLRLNFSDERDELNNKVEELHKDFSVRLQSKYPQLSPQERKLAALLRLEFPTKYIATVLNISPKSVEIERHRLRQKFGLDRKTRLTDFIKTI